MARKPKLSEDQIAEIRRLHFEDGVSYKSLAHEYDVSYQTVRRACEPEKYAIELEASKEYQKANASAIYERKNKDLRMFRFALSRESDQKMIEHLDSQESFKQYIKDLIASDMDKTDIAAGQPADNDVDPQ